MTQRLLDWINGHDLCGNRAWIDGDAIVIPCAWINPDTRETGVDYERVSTLAQARFVLGY